MARLPPRLPASEARPREPSAERERHSDPDPLTGAADRLSGNSAYLVGKGDPRDTFCDGDVSDQRDRKSPAWLPDGVTDHDGDASGEGDQPAEKDESALGKEIFDDSFERIAAKRAECGKHQQIQAEELGKEE